MVKKTPRSRSSLSSVVVVKKKRFNFGSSVGGNEAVSSEKKEVLPEVKEESLDIKDRVEEKGYLEQTTDDILASSSLKSSDSKVRNLDDHFSASTKELSKKQEQKQKRSVKRDIDDKEEVIPDVVVEPLLVDKVEVVKKTKDFINDIRIVSHSKEKKYNSKDEASLFFNKQKYVDGRKNQNFYDDEEVEKERLRSIASIKRSREKAKRSLSEENIVSKVEEKKIKEIVVPEIITVQELANRMAVRSADVVKELMKMGMMITATKPIDADTAELLVTEFGHTPKRVLESDIEKILDSDTLVGQENRFPVVSVMGHVDHGKTSLLDAMRETDIVSSESGGITQHIGASVIKVNKEQSITFLDTPGHEAFTAMRLRGAHATDMVILVVAADDGVKAQTIEAINHARAANIPIIVAINKIDKEGSNPSRVVNELLTHEVVVESLGGECLCVEVSAEKKVNLDKLIDAILLQSEVLELGASRNGDAKGVVIESKVDKERGAVTTLLVQDGALKIGDIVIAGTSYGKVRLMVSDKGHQLKTLFPSEPAEVLGLGDAPGAGEKFHVVKSEKIARDIVEYRIKKQRDIVAAKKSKKTLEDIFSHMTDEKRMRLSLVVKADVKGSVEAITESLEKISNDSVKVNVIHAAVGGISESDIVLAQASDAMIIGFNVRLGGNVKESDVRDIDIRYFSIIYDVIDAVEDMAHGLLKPVEKEVELGKGEIRQVFNVSKAGNIAGSYVLSGVVKRSGKCRIIRDSIVLSDTSIKALKRYKDDVKEVNTGSECGITFENCTDFKEGDQLEFYEVIEEKSSRK